MIGGDGRGMLGTLGVDRLARAVDLGDVRVAKVGEDILVRAELGGRDAVD